MSQFPDQTIRVRKREGWPQGRVESVGFDSAALAGNIWGDPTNRDLKVYLPYGYDDGDQRYPVFWSLAAFTNSGASADNWRGFSENLYERIDRLIFERRMGPVIVVAPDCFTTLGGNQYVNSPAMGNYADYLHDELIPLIDQRFRTLAQASQRACFGKSSGGYAALRFGMLHGKHWGAIASHAGDVGFDLVYRRDFPIAALRLARFDGDVSRFLHYFWQTESPSGDDFHTLMAIAMAASYDPDPSTPLGFQLPFDLQTLEIDQQRWAKWLAHDPLHILESHADALKNLRGIYIDVGTRDQYCIQYGSRVLHRELKRRGVAHHYEEFDGTHSGIDHRLDESLPYLYRVLSR